MAIFNRIQFYWNYLTADPLNFVLFIVYYCACILLTLILHEIAHGYIAYRCGDPTAKMLGRLSFDPRKHLDPLGTVFMMLFGFGWAKPVPVNPRNFENYRRDDFLVSVAGITVNLTLFFLALSLAIPINNLLWKENVLLYNGGAKAFLSSDGIGYNILFLNGGSDYLDFMKTPWLRYIQRFLLLFSHMNLCVGLFNLLPIPPLDGFHIVNDLLLKGRLSLNRQFFQIAQLVVLFLCFSGALSGLLSNLFTVVEQAVLNLLLMIAGL